MISPVFFCFIVLGICSKETAYDIDVSEDDLSEGNDCSNGDCAFVALQRRAAAVSHLKRGTCDCAWTAGGDNCGDSDGSVCWTECCGSKSSNQRSASDSCSDAVWKVAYSPSHCHKVGDALILSCNSQLGNQCGTRLSSNTFVGQGSHSVGIKAAPGAGVATTFYLSNNGGMYDKTKTHPWVELDFEIMGQKAGNQSMIWTNMFTGIANEHWKWITVPFDVTADYHTFEFALDHTRVAWKVDGVVYREEIQSKFSDVKSAISTSALQEFVSVWGKSLSDPGEGIPEFRAGLSVLDTNRNMFPIFAGFKLPG